MAPLKGVRQNAGFSSFNPSSDGLAADAVKPVAVVNCCTPPPDRLFGDSDILLTFVLAFRLHNACSVIEDPRDIMASLIKEIIDQAIEQQVFGHQPTELYEPIRYIMRLGGKRLRPTLTLLAYQLFQDDISQPSVLHPALAVEVFHNFSLMHDDIMDEAPLRRGKPTVHERWNPNVAILSGDVMLVKAYELLMHTAPEKLPAVLTAFNRCATDVCEGQQWDMNYETVSQVSEADYLRMIRLKTAVLLGFSLQLGGLLANANEQITQLLYTLGVNIGIGFQLKDDLLDVYADQAKFGKQPGGDIIANKKTFLLIKALEKAKGEQHVQLVDWLSRPSFDKDEKVKAVKLLYDQLDIRTLTEATMNNYFQEGLAQLQQLEAEEARKQSLRTFIEPLIHREK